MNRVNIVDSCGWLEYLTDGTNASFFAPPIEDTAKLLVPALSLYEVFKVVYKARGEHEALQAIALMYQGEILPFDEVNAIVAAKLSVAHSLPMADAIMYATARQKKATLWTQDKDFEKLNGVRYVAKDTD